MAERASLCYHPEKFCEHTHCDNGNMFLIAHVTSRDHTFEKIRCVNLWAEAPLSKSQFCHVW